MPAICLSLALTAGSVLADVGRPEYSRADLSELKKLDRAGVFGALGSFDEAGLSDNEFVAQALDLLDAEKIPGLSDAQQTGDWQAALHAIYEACRAGRSAPTRTEASAGAMAVADDVLENRFTFYGEKHQLPVDIDWNTNPGTAHWGHDLNRFTYLSPLVRAYIGTGDERYSRKAVELILDWVAKCQLEKCFVGTPYVWGSYLNNAIHCQAWCSHAATLVAADKITPLELLRVLKSVHDQLAYLEIVTNKHAGNWPTIGMQGMLTCLGTFPVFRDTDRFADYCTREFAKQVAAQVLSDGVQDELTPHYHRVVVNNLLNALHWLRVLDRDLDSVTMATLAKMLHYTQQAAVPDGSKQVAFNDSDPGSVSRYAARLKDMGLPEMVTPPEGLGPEVFPYAGVAFLRQRQDVGDLYLAFDAGPYGRSHQHEDKLGFWLFAYGRNLIVDPGRHLYDHSAKSYYPYLKSTSAHSTIRVDGQNQHSRGRRETWIAKQPLDLGWQVQDGEIRASGLYDLGYGPENEISVVHRREIVFVRERFWVAFDVVEGEGEHHLESRFQFAPGDLTADGAAAHTDFPDANLLLLTEATAPFADVHVEKGQENPRGGWYSDSYNRIEPAPALSMSVGTELPWRAATLLFPYKGTDAPAVEFTFDGRHATVASAELGAGDIEVACRLP